MWKLADIPDWSYHGVNHSIKGNGGPDCVNFISPQRRIFETIIAFTIGVVTLYWGYKRCSVPSVPKVTREDRGGKRLLLVLMCLIFGIEIGFKFSSRTVIYLLNPCHVITAIQIFLLAAPPTSKVVTFLFRVHIHCLYGAILAILFPVLNTRKRALELEIYWIQHFLILIIPFYLLRTGVGVILVETGSREITKEFRIRETFRFSRWNFIVLFSWNRSWNISMQGVYTVEPMRDMSWAVLTQGVLFIYHFIVLQPLGILTQVNLNNMVCPAVSDPFYGPNYRLWAILHQSALMLLFGKIYTILSLLILQALGTVVWTGEKYVVMAALRVQQLCSMCKAQISRKSSKSEDFTHVD